MVGLFTKFNIDMTWDAAQPLQGSISATLDASSVKMGMDKLEGHLQSPDFFDVAKFPEWSFESTSITADKKSKSKTKYIANGKLTVHGVTKDVAIPFEFLGMLEDPRGNTAGFGAEFTINRLDYGVGQDGGGMLGNDVKINVLLELHPKK
jgi:polyisoprenoid-binding protein YceI